MFNVYVKAIQFGPLALLRTGHHKFQSNLSSKMCQFVPTSIVSSLDRGEPRQFRLLKSYDVHIPEENFNLTITNETCTQTDLIEKQRKGKRAAGDKQEISLNNSLSGIKTMVSTRKSFKRKQIRLMDWKKFHQLKDIYDFVDELERDYPAICTVSVIGKSVEGRDIKLLKVSNSDARNEAVWLDASIHPREWISTAVVTYIADQLVRNFKKLPKWIISKDWHIVPVLNPDGYEFTHTDDRMWRKNRSKYDAENVGVDLNRNFSYGWGVNGEEGSSDDPSNVFYRGPGPFSEPETAAVRDFIMNSNTPFKVFLSFHSYFELIIFPWGFKTEPCPHYLRLLEGAMTMSRAIYESSGVIYKVGSTKDLTYFACGTSIDWSYGVAKIPYSYMVELRSKKYKFKVPKDQIVETCIEVWNAVKSLMDFVDQQET